MWIVWGEKRILGRGRFRDLWRDGGCEPWEGVRVGIHWVRRQGKLMISSNRRCNHDQVYMDQSFDLSIVANKNMYGFSVHLTNTG